jgi:hypothetical protein
MGVVYKYTPVAARPRVRVAVRHLPPRRLDRFTDFVVYYGPVELSSSDLKFVDLSDDLLGLLRGDNADPYPKRAGLNLPVKDPTDLYNSFAAVPRLADEVWLYEILGVFLLLGWHHGIPLEEIPYLAVSSPAVSRKALYYAESHTLDRYLTERLLSASGPSALFLHEIPSFISSGDWVKYGACLELKCSCSGVAAKSVGTRPPVTPRECGYKYYADAWQDPAVQAELAKSPRLSALASNPFYGLFSDCALTDPMVPCVSRGLRVVRPADGGLPLSAEPFVRSVSTPDEVPVGARYAAAYSDLAPVRAVAEAFAYTESSGQGSVAGANARSGQFRTHDRRESIRHDADGGSHEVYEFDHAVSYAPGPCTVGSSASFSPHEGRMPWNLDGSLPGDVPFRSSYASRGRHDVESTVTADDGRSLVERSAQSTSESDDRRFVPGGRDSLSRRLGLARYLDDAARSALADCVDGVWLGVQVVVASISGRGTAESGETGRASLSGSSTAVSGSYVRFVEGTAVSDGVYEFRLPVAGRHLPEQPPSPDFSVTWSDSGDASPGDGSSCHELLEGSESTRVSYVVGTGPVVVGIRPRVEL